MKVKRVYIVLTLCCLALVLIAYLTPKEVDWTATYAETDKIPFGDYILYEQLKDIFPGSEIEKQTTAFYNFDVDNADSGANYIIITHDLSPDALDVRHLTSYAAQGNNIFIAASGLSQKLADTLGINLKGTPRILPKDTGDYYSDFTDTTLRSKSPYRFRHANLTFGIEDADSSSGSLFQSDSGSRSSIVRRPRTVLGTDESGKANFVKIPFGKGAFFIHSFPVAFTNYYILKKDNSDYISKCLSYLPDRHTYWDNYYKPYRVHPKAQTPLRFILSIPAYTWALFTALFAVVLYMLFASKRVQRIIPILSPPVNQSLLFTRTIGTLYYQQADHRDIAVKKMIYLLEKIRQQYLMQTANTDGAFRARLMQKSNVDIETINAVFDIYETEIRRVTYITEPVLIRFNAALETFYSQSGLINK